MEPARRIELRLTPYHGVVLPLSLSRHELAGLDSNQRRRTVQSRSAPADRATGHRSPSPGSNWAGRPYKGPPDAGPKGITYARRDSNPHLLGPQPSPSAICGTSAQSRHPVPTRITRCTRARPQPCAAAKLAILASNQETPGPEPGGSANSPNGHQGAEGAIRTHMPRGLSSRGMPVPFTPARVRRQGLEPRTNGLRVRYSAN